MTVQLNRWKGRVVMVECCSVIWVAEREESIVGRDSEFSYLSDYTIKKYEAYIFCNPKIKKKWFLNYTI